MRGWLFQHFFTASSLSFDGEARPRHAETALRIARLAAVGAPHHVTQRAKTANKYSFPTANDAAISPCWPSTQLAVHRASWAAVRDARRRSPNPGLTGIHGDAALVSGWGPGRRSVNRRSNLRSSPATNSRSPGSCEEMLGQPASHSLSPCESESVSPALVAVPIFSQLPVW